MARWRQIVVVAPAALLLTACGSLASLLADSPTPYTPKPPTSASTSAAPRPSATADSDDPLAGYYSQQVDWRDCGSAQCGVLSVPLDYEDPDGPAVDLAILRVPATGEKIGTLFVNPGGPGGSAAEYAAAADYIVTPAIRERYDIVGLDPRGVANSDPVHCLTGEQTDELLAADGTPDDAAEEQETLDLSLSVGQGCEDSGSDVWRHMGTPDAARDMDVARVVLGEDKLDYLGKSYGSMLGETYAQLFPQNVGRMVLDGDLPSGLDIIEISKGQADAFEDQLADFVAYCLDSTGCPLEGSVDEGVAQVRDWLQSLDADPIDYNGRIFNEPVATYALLSYLYFPPNDYDQLIPALASAMDGDPATMFSLLDARISRNPDGTYEDNSTDAFYAVSCLDRPFTGTIDDVKRYAEEWSQSAPTFGAGLAWGLLVCKDWPATEDAMPTSDLSALPPILVVTTTHDPATPYQWGVQMSEELPGSVLLTWDGHQHTAYTQGSACIDDAVDAFYLDGTLPPEGTVCS